VIYKALDEFVQAFGWRLSAGSRGPHAGATTRLLPAAPRTPRRQGRARRRRTRAERRHLEDRLGQSVHRSGALIAGHLIEAIGSRALSGRL
jgi:hypothetical protein